MQPETLGWQVRTNEQMHPTTPPTAHLMCMPPGHTGPNPAQMDADLKGGRGVAAEFGKSRRL